MQGQEPKVGADVLKLPAIMPQRSKCDLRKNGYDDVEKPNGFEATSKVETLPNICRAGKNSVKMVAFEDGVQSEANYEKDSVLRLPNIHKSASRTQCLDQGRRFSENCQTNKNNLPSLDNGQGMDSRFSYKKEDFNGNNAESFPSIMKNYEYHRDLRYTQCSQKLSRARYSYFPRFPSPLPLNKREKLKQEVEEKTSKKREEVIHPGSLRTKEEYSKIFLSLRKVEKQFVKKHKLSCRPLDSPFFLD